MLENVTSQTEDMALAMRQISDRIKQFLDNLLTKLNASEILQEVIPRSSKE
jgi:hypothetical protein